MPVNKNDYFPSNLKGNTAIAKNTLAVLRGSVRRSDPDGVSNTPYFPNASGKSLKITYTKEVATVVTDTVVNVALASTDYATIINTINAVDPSNLLASDLGGFLAIQNLNPGKTHRIEVNAFATPANDAAPILGFVVTPYPGSVSYVDEIGSTPGIKGQNNPQGTALIGKGEDLDADSVNRALSAVLSLVENNSIDLDTPVIVFKDVALTFALQAASGLYYASIADDTIKLPIKATELGGITALDKYFKVFVDSGGARLQTSVQTLSNTVSGYTAHAYVEDSINAAVYGTSLITIDPSVSFATWGTPDGHSIYGTAVPNKDKQASTAVTSITGNVIYCAGATFQTNKVSPGDPVFLTASVLTPFDHTGWFIVKKVFDETHISVRPVGPSELVPAAGNTPKSLNPAANGTLRVAMGYYIPAGSVLIVAPRAGTFVVRMAVAVPLREALAYDLANVSESRKEAVLSLLNAHLITTNAAADPAHPTSAIRGFDSTNNWADGTVMHYAASDLKTFIQDMIGILADETLGAGGTRKIGGAAISIGGSAPNSISAGTLYVQLSSLLTALQSHVNQVSGAHAATAISYAGGGNWADGTTNPATTVEGQLDKLVSDLAGATGTAKIQGAAVDAYLPVDTLANQLVKLEQIARKPAPLNEPDTSPLHAFYDFNNHPRFLVDHNGFPMGQISTLEEHWHLQTSAPFSNPISPGWTTSTAGGATVTFPGIAPPPPLATIINHRTVELKCVTGGPGGSATLTSVTETQLLQDVSYVLEFPICLRTAVAQNPTIFLGVTDGGTPANSISFEYDHAVSTTWRFRSNAGGPTTDVNTTITVADSTLYIMRLEFIGPSISGSGNARIRGYINGTLVGNTTIASWPGVVGVPIFLKFNIATAVAPANDVFMYCGRIRRCWTDLNASYYL